MPIKKREAGMTDFDQLVQAADGDPVRIQQLIDIADLIISRRDRRRKTGTRRARR